MFPATLDAMCGASAVICILQNPESTLCISSYFAVEKLFDQFRSNHTREEDVIGKLILSLVKLETLSVSPGVSIQAPLTAAAPYSMGLVNTLGIWA